eukprot:3636909-Pyramimonas_sp.AAC.1
MARPEGGRCTEFRTVTGMWQLVGLARMRAASSRMGAQAPSFKHMSFGAGASIAPLMCPAWASALWRATPWPTAFAVSMSACERHWGMAACPVT